MGQRDLRAELEAADDRDPQVWKPEVGDMLVGTLVRYDEIDGKFGLVRAAFVDEDGTGQLRYVYLSTVVMIAEFEKADPQPGDRIGLKRLQDGATFKRFSLLVERADRTTENSKQPTA